MDGTIEPYHQMTYTLIGINYKQLAVSHRGLYHLSTEQLEDLYQQGKKASLSDLYILSTCNRTELYALCQRPSELLDLLFSVLPSEMRADFEKLGYMKRGKEAIMHLFRVTSGLDSQILGDYEIVGQVKTAFYQAKDFGINYSAFGERVLNVALEAAKKVRTKTQISSGTLSVSMAAVQSIVREYPNTYQKKRMLLIGFGDIGKSVYAYLRNFEVEQVAIANRSPEKIAEVHTEAQVYGLPQLPQILPNVDIVIAATAATEPIVKFGMLPDDGHERLLIDLSLPANLDINLAKIKGIKFKQLDEISQVLEETKQNRAKEVPKAENILQKVLQELLVWIHERKQMALLKEIKRRLLALDNISPSAKKDAQKHINELARCFRKQQDFKGCSVISTYQKYLYGEPEKCV